MKQKPKCLIFGIDGGTFDIIDPLIAQGRLPALAALMRDGVSARTTCTWPPHTAPGWASFVAGGRPGHHSIYQFFDTQDREYRARIVGSGDFGCATAWDCLAAAGWTLGLLNVPMSHPVRPLPGYQITWPLSNTLRYCDPPALLGDLTRAGAHFRSDLATMYRGEPDYIESALQNIDARVHSVEYLLRHRPVDLVMVVLTEIDRVCHHYWQYSDPSHPRFEATPPAYARAIERAYESVDRALGDILRLVPDDSVVTVVSDHGFGPGHQSFAVNRYLEDAGSLRTMPGGTGQSETLASWFTENNRTVDWTHTRAYMPVPGCNGLTVNLKRRQRCGSVSPQDFESVVDDTIALLADVRVPPASTPAFARVLRREEAFHGPWAAKSPDILMIPADETMIVTGSLDGPLWSPSYQTGLHRYEGMWIHRSPRIDPGRRSDRVDLIDLFPTLLADLGVDAHASMPGRVIPSVWSSDAAAPLPVAAGSHGPSETELETELLTRRLKDLGYI